MKLALCPYCGSDCFGETIRADAVNPDNPERFAQVYGHWFNKCKDCAGWSLYADGEQREMENSHDAPAKYSLPAI